MNFTNLDIAQLAMYVDIDGMEPEDAANKWLADNCGRWTGWTGADSSACPEAPAAAPDSTDAIKLPIHNWSSQIAGVYAVGAMLESTGNSVEYISADSSAGVHWRCVKATWTSFTKSGRAPLVFPFDGAGRQAGCVIRRRHPRRQDP